MVTRTSTDGDTTIRLTEPSLTDSRNVADLAIDLGDVEDVDTKLVASQIHLARIARQSRVRFMVHACPHLEDVLCFCRVTSIIDLV